MAIPLSKAIEILELNLKDAGKHMPQDCQEAIQLHLEIAKAIQACRLIPDCQFTQPFPTEAPAKLPI